MRSQDGWSWSKPAPFPSQQPDGVKSVDRPALAKRRGLSYLAWKNSKTGGLNYTFSSRLDVDFWLKVLLLQPNGPPLLALSDTAPALAVFKDRIYLAWADLNQKIHLAHLAGLFVNDDGLIWKEVVVSLDGAPLNESTDRAPALAASAEELVLAWRGVDPDHRPNVLRSEDGENFFGKETFLTESSENGPALTYHEGSFYLAWSEPKDKGYNLRLFQRVGTEWGQKTVLHEKSTEAPVLASQDGFLVIGWTGTDGRLNVARLATRR
jgi:hypothetical protein